MKYTINVKTKVTTDPPNNQTNPSITLLFITLPPYFLSRDDLNNLSINLNHLNYSLTQFINYFILFLLLAFLFLLDLCTVYTSCLNVSFFNASPVRNLLILSPPLVIIFLLYVKLLQNLLRSFLLFL